MYKSRSSIKTTLKVNQAVEGETIEAKVRRITEQNEAITDGAPQIFTDRADGVLPEHNIRTDRWELATEAMDKVTAQKLAKREGAAATATEGAKAKGKPKGKAQGKSQDGGTQAGGESGSTTTGPSSE